MYYKYFNHFLSKKLYQYYVIGKPLHRLIFHVLFIPDHATGTYNLCLAHIFPWLISEFPDFLGGSVTRQISVI